MNFITGIQATSSALSAEKIRMDLVAQNVANANVTRDINGKAYQRKVVTFETLLGNDGTSQGVKIGRILNDSRPGEKVFNPQHPDADKDGMVTMPNVNPAIEMVDLISASRAYEANLAVARNARTMATKALSIGK
jgi:flagellar basal-body rod protein FlgC